MPERDFLIFWISFLFFSEFSFPGPIWTEFGTKFFFFILGLSQPILDRNNPEINFLNFLNFLWNFLPRDECKQNSGLKVFSLFFGQSHPVFTKNNARKRFLIFSIFLLFFSEFSSPGRVRTEFWTKRFFSLSRPTSSRFG